MPILRYFLQLIILILAAEATASAANITVYGKVTDEQSQPMEFVTVRIDGTAVGTTTNLDGAYRLSTAAADTVTVVFSCLGYEEQRRRLIEPKGDIALNIRMLTSTHTLGEVEVTEIRKQTGSMQLLSPGDYRLAADASGGSIESLLATQAGVNSSNEMSSQYSVRGGTYDENSVYINGVEVYRPQLISSGQQEGLSVINPDLVGAIGFSTGGFTAAYGDKMSSALDITYREPEAFEGSVSAGFMGGSLSIGQASKRFSQLHGFRYKRNSSLLGSLETKGEYDPNFFDYQTSLSFKITPRLKASFLGNVAINNYNFTPTTRTTNFGTSSDAKQFKVYFDGHEKDKFETWFGAFTLNYKHSKSQEFSLLASGFLTNELVTYDIQGEYWLDQAGTSGGIGGELGVGRYQEHARNRLKASVFTLALKGATGISRHTLNYGLTLTHDKILDRSSEWELRDSAGYSLPTDPGALKMIYSQRSHNDLSSTHFSGFVMDTYRIPTSAGYLSANGGIRFSYWTFNREFLVSPRINLGFVPDAAPAWAFRFATGLYYQTPFYKEFRLPVDDGQGNMVVTLNDSIRSQRSFHLIGGVDYTFRAMNRPFKLSAEVYYKRLSNLIPYEIDNLKIVYSGRNETSGYTAGIDMKFFGQFVPGSDSWVSFSLMKTNENLRGTNVPRPTDQRYSVAVFFTDYFPKFPKLKFSLRGIFSDGLPTTAPRGSRDKGYFRTPAYKRLDIGLAYGLVTPTSDGTRRSGFLRHFKSIWLSADIFNLFDISNVSSYYWVTDVNNIQYAVPNYLTRRQLNFKIAVEF